MQEKYLVEEAKAVAEKSMHSRGERFPISARGRNLKSSSSITEGRRA